MLIEHFHPMKTASIRFAGLQTGTLFERKHNDNTALCRPARAPGPGAIQRLLLTLSAPQRVGHPGDGLNFIR